MEMKILNWQTAREKVLLVNEPLVKIIDQLPTKLHGHFIQASYAYGDPIIKSGKLFQSKPSGASFSNNHTIKELIDCDHPLPFILLNKSCEIFMKHSDRIVPLNLWHAGDLLGTANMADDFFSREANSKLTICAGARSLFMLPKITAHQGHNRLRSHYNLSPDIQNPKRLVDQFGLFQAISKDASIEKNWQCDILFFSKSWFDTKSEQTPLHQYMIKRAKKENDRLVDKAVFSFAWQHFIDAVGARYLKCRPYIADTIRHIMAVALGAWPAFRPALQHDKAAPITDLQRAFIDVYKLQTYLPTFMQPALFNEKNHFEPVYYSLAFPTFLEGALPDNKFSPTILSDLREIKLLLDKVIADREGLLGDLQFEYFHPEPDPFNEIQASSAIAAKDPSFTSGTAAFNGYSFCATAPFWRGCIKISKKTD